MSLLVAFLLFLLLLTVILLIHLKLFEFKLHSCHVQECIDNGFFFITMVQRFLSSQLSVDLKLFKYSQKTSKHKGNIILRSLMMDAQGTG